jgi:hypothetical protein
MFAGTHTPTIIPQQFYWEQNVNAAGILDLVMPIALNPGDAVLYVIQTALNVSKASSVTLTDQGGHSNVPLLFYDGPTVGSAFHGVVFLHYPTGQVQDAIVRFNLNGAAFWGAPTWLSAYRLTGATRIQNYWQQPGSTTISTTPVTFPFLRTTGTRLVAHRTTSVLTMGIVVSADNNMSVTATGYTPIQSNNFSVGASLSARTFWKYNATGDEITTSQRQVVLVDTAAHVVDMAFIRFIG